MLLVTGYGFLVSPKESSFGRVQILFVSVAVLRALCACPDMSGPLIWLMQGHEEHEEDTRTQSRYMWFARLQASAKELTPFTNPYFISII